MTEDGYIELKKESLRELEGLRAKGANVDHLIQYINDLEYQELSSNNINDSDLIPCGAFD